MRKAIALGRRLPALVLAVLPLCITAILLVSGCAPKPDAGIAERAIAEHFEKEGYRVSEITIGSVSRNPIAEREYMAPLTYVVEVQSIVLEEGGMGFVEHGRTNGNLAFSNISVKVQALSPPQQGWVVSSVKGIDLPVSRR